MHTISIVTSQNIEVEYDLGSLGDRIVAYLIDGIILFAYVITAIAIIGFGNFGQFLESNIWTAIILMLPLFFYHLVCEVAFNGQSVGKRVMGIKVISLSGEQAALSQYLIRWLFRLVDFSITNGILAVILVAVTERKQRLGDLVAGTTLVKTKARTSFDDTIYTPTVEANYVITYPEVINLRDRDVQLIREVISSVYKSRNLGLAWHAQEKLEGVLRIKSRHMEPMDFLRALLADYNHITSKL